MKVLDCRPPPNGEPMAIALITQPLAHLTFLRQARQVGFTIDQCRQLLTLHENPERKSAAVHAMVADKLVDVRQHIQELENMCRVLSELISTCPNDEQAQCAIIDSLAGNDNAEHCAKAWRSAVENRDCKYVQLLSL